jgi:hypothetical protein
MGKRFAIVIGVAAAGVMALGAQTALAGGAPHLHLAGDKTQSQAIVPPIGGEGWWLGCDRAYCAVQVKVSCGDEWCTARAKGKLTNVKNDKLKPRSPRVAPGEWAILNLGLTLKTRKQALKALDSGKNVQAKVTVKATDAAGHVATAKRTIRLVKSCANWDGSGHCLNGRAASDPVDSTPPDLQLSGKKKQSQGSDPECTDRCGPWAVKVKASCGDEACTVRANGKLTNVKRDKLEPHNSVDLHLAPGETRNIVLELTKSQRKQARKALDKGKKVQATVTVEATDAAGNVATAKRTIKLVK